MKSKVYFSKTITPEKVVELFQLTGKTLDGSTAIKIHSGEVGNQNFLKPDFWKPIIDHVGGTVVECNTAYEGSRDTTAKHMKTLREHGWSKYFNVDILDSEKDEVLENSNGEVIQKNYVGSKMKNYDSMLVLSHFKGHPMGGFGGAIKNLSIGLASSRGKNYIHCSGDEFGNMMEADHDNFLKSMADSAKTITDFYKNKIVYINAMVNMSVDCDCCRVAEDPCMKDIGILASTDPVALDQACVDLVYNSEDPGKEKLIERIESRNGLLTILSAEKQGMGSREYELIILE